jgi:hypothetical protein
MGRVLAHELYHILSHSTNHFELGVAKSRFSGSDLIKSRLEFDELALDRMHASQTPNAVPETAGFGGGGGFRDEALGGK